MKSLADRKLNIRTLTSTAMLTAVSFALAFVEIPLLLSPSFAKFKLSDLPALIGAFALGTAAGLMIELIKNLPGLLSSNTGGIGEFANILKGDKYGFQRYFKEKNDSKKI